MTPHYIHLFPHGKQLCRNTEKHKNKNLQNIPSRTPVMYINKDMTFHLDVMFVVPVVLIISLIMYPELVFIYLCLQINTKVFVSLMYHSISHGKYVCPIFSQDKS